MLLTNLILSSLIAFNSSFDYNSPIRIESKLKVQEESFSLKENVLVSYITSCWLIHQDIFVYTKPNFYKITRVVTNQIDKNTIVINSYRAKELNPVARVFVENNLYELAYIVSVSGIALGQSLLMNIDSSGISANVFTVAINIIEGAAILSWVNIFNLDANFSIPVFTYTF